MTVGNLSRVEILYEKETNSICNVLISLRTYQVEWDMELATGIGTQSIEFITTYQLQSRCGYLSSLDPNGGRWEDKGGRRWIWLSDEWVHERIAEVDGD
jgi:hypothetical protein